MSTPADSPVPTLMGARSRAAWYMAAHLSLWSSHGPVLGGRVLDGGRLWCTTPCDPPESEDRFSPHAHQHSLTNIYKLGSSDGKTNLLLLLATFKSSVQLSVNQTCVSTFVEMPLARVVFMPTFSCSEQ